MASIDITILGQKYTIKGDYSEEQMKELSRYIDGKIKEVCDKYPNITPIKALILAMFNVSDEFQSLKREQDDLAKHIEEKADLLSGLLD
ncbi:MAG: cell division protein ZapA [Nitrospirota bacterium]|jgi:cell division protein ZapA